MTRWVITAFCVYFAIWSAANTLVLAGIAKSLRDLVHIELLDTTPQKERRAGR